VSAEDMRDALVDDIVRHNFPMHAPTVLRARIDAIIAAARTEVYGWVAQNEAHVHAERARRCACGRPWDHLVHDRNANLFNHEPVLALGA
jgi:hypothetical protein